MPVLGSGNYLKTEDANPGDVIRFVDEGEWIESNRWKYDDGTPKVDFVIGIEIRGENKKMRLNKTNRDAMIEVYGNNTADWIGKTAVITKEKVMVAGKRMDTIILDAAMDSEINLDDSGQEIPF